MAHLANAIYQAKPEVIGTNKKFTLDSSVIKANVATFTGVKPGGTMTVNNTTFNTPTETTTSYWAKNGPADLSFRFGIGGTDANYADYWKKVIPKPKPKPTTPKKETEDEKEKEEKEADDEKKDDTETEKETD